MNRYFIPEEGRRDYPRRSYARIDQIEPVANLAKRVDAGGGGEDGKAADPEEGEQQSRANPEMPSAMF